MLKTLWKIYKILRWHKKTFPEYDWNKQFQKICEESIEYVDESLFKFGDNVLEEGADVIIASIGALRFPETWDLVDEKMIKNKQRKWKNGHHVVRKSNYK